MLKFLFPRLTAHPERGADAFAALTALARNPAYYRDANVADTLDGRFAMLATLTALALVRIEREGASGAPLSVAVTERFIEAMEAEHREIGISDPTLGKTVRKLVAGLERRIDLWREIIAGEEEWTQATCSSLGKHAGRADLGVASELLRGDWERLAETSLADLADGRLA